MPLVKTYSQFINRRLTICYHMNFCKSRFGHIIDKYNHSYSLNILLESNFCFRELHLIDQV